MKKVITFFCTILLLVSTTSLCAQDEYYQTDPTAVRTVTVWFIPRTDSLLMYADARPILASAGRLPVYMMGSPALYDTLVNHFASKETYAGVKSGEYVGYQFSVGYIKDFSLYSSKQLRDMRKKNQITPQQEAIILAFNATAKYTVLAENPYTVRGIKMQDPYTKEVWIQEVIDGQSNQTKNPSIVEKTQTPGLKQSGAQKIQQTQTQTKTTKTSGKDPMDKLQ